MNGLLGQRKTADLAAEGWPGEGEILEVSGVVYRQEFKAAGQSIYLKNISVKSEPESGVESSKSKQKKRKLLVYLEKREDVCIGERVWISGEAQYPEPAGNPGGFDAKKYYESQGIVGIVKEGIVKAQDHNSYPVRNALSWFRQACRTQIYRAAGSSGRAKDAAGILCAMLLGDRAGLDGEIKEKYQNSGIIHLLAISGLHISMLGMALYRFLRRMRLSFGLAGGAAGAVMAAYGCMTGFAFSAVRALCMFLLFLLSQVVGRTYDMATSLTLAAAVILIGNPGAASQAGFLLSFSAVAGILLSGVWESRLFRKTSLGSSLMIQAATVPLCAYFYYQIPLYAVLLNFLVIPLMPVVLGFGMAGMVLAVFAREWGQFFFAPAYYLLEAVEFLCDLFVRLPFAVLRVGVPPFWKLPLYYLMLGGFCWLFSRKNGRRIKNEKIDLLKLAVAIILLTGVLYNQRESVFTMSFLDVGQGDGCCIQTRKNRVWMVDGGSSTEKQLARYTLEPFFKSRGISRIDGWLISHYDQDHVSGLLDILKGYQRNLLGQNGAGVSIGLVILPDRKPADAASEQIRDTILNLAEQNGIAVQYAGRGDVLRTEEMRIRVLAPHREAIYENENAGSMVLEISADSFRVLLTGDLEGQGEELLLGEKTGLVQSAANSGTVQTGKSPYAQQKSQVRDVDVLKASHHGSRNATSQELIAACTPEAAVISAGRGNRYGHPHQELLGRLEEYGCRIFRTDRQGAVEIRVMEERYRLQGFLREVSE